MNDTQQTEAIPDDDPTWGPVRIEPRTPNTLATNLHHRHGAGFACTACEIIALRREVERAEATE